MRSAIIITAWVGTGHNDARTGTIVLFELANALPQEHTGSVRRLCHWIMCWLIRASNLKGTSLYLNLFTFKCKYSWCSLLREESLRFATPSVFIHRILQTKKKPLIRVTYQYAQPSIPRKSLVGVVATQGSSHANPSGCRTWRNPTSGVPAAPGSFRWPESPWLPSSRGFGSSGSQCRSAV